MRVSWMLSMFGASLLTVPLAFAEAESEARRPEDGGARIRRLYPSAPSSHVTNDAGSQHAQPIVVKNLFKDPRSDQAHDVISSGPSE